MTEIYLHFICAHYLGARERTLRVDARWAGQSAGCASHPSCRGGIARRCRRGTCSPDRGTGAGLSRALQCSGPPRRLGLQSQSCMHARIGRPHSLIRHARHARLRLTYTKEMFTLACAAGCMLRSVLAPDPLMEGKLSPRYVPAPLYIQTMRVE